MNDLRVADEQLCVLEETHKRWAKLLSRSGILCLYGMTGFGKTTQALSFAQRQYKEWERISAAEENFLENTAQRLTELGRQRAKALLILDDLQWLFSPQSRQKLFELLVESRQARRLHILLVSRAAPLSYLSPLWATQQMAVENQEALRIGKEQGKDLLLTNSTLSGL